MRSKFALALSVFCVGQPTWAQPASAQQTGDPLTRPIAPEYAQRWLTPQAPTRIYGNTYSVGFGGLSVVLIDTGAGLVLVDGAVPQSVADVERNIRQLGFRVEDIAYILSTEPHYDHGGGIAALARDSGARVVASPEAARALRNGRIPEDDPQFGQVPPMPAIADIREISDGETLHLGNTTITARATPGHTAGSMSWTWSSCEAETCRDIVFASSINPVSRDGYLFSDPAKSGIVAQFRRSFEAFRAIDCDILITAHPDMSGSEPDICRNYAAHYENVLDRRLAEGR